jgi:DNA-binding CsgD family transcriptional regulator
MAVDVFSSRGEWSNAESHANRATAKNGDYELMIVSAGLAKANLAWHRGDHEMVLRVLEPVLAIQRREGVDEPGFWPWQHLYADALVSAGRLEDALTFLAPHEQLAEKRQRRSSIARLARVRGRAEAAAGRYEFAEVAFKHGIDQIRGLAMPFEQALLELAYGKVLRRRGHRRGATSQLESARERFSTLGARNFVETCEMELTGNGLAPTRRTNSDPARLTPQEVAVARLAVSGMSNSDIALRMSIGVKTVQFHVSNVYSKLGVRNRLQLANRLAEIGTLMDSTDRN